MIVCFIIVTGISFKRKITGKILIILDLLTILISPAYLSIALGGNVVYRTQVIYPYLTLFIIFVLFIFRYKQCIFCDNVNIAHFLLQLFYLKISLAKLE